MIGSGKKEQWPECFQDLGSWCPLPQDELHTPKVNLSDEFNFSIDEGHANDWDTLSSTVDLQIDPWGNDTQFGISTCQPEIGAINNTFVQERTPQGVISNKTPNLLGSGGKILYTLTTDGSRSPLKPKGNVLLSQGIVKSSTEDSTFLSMAANIENKSNNSVVIANNCYVLPLEVPEFENSAKLNSSSLSTSFLTPAIQSPSPTSHMSKVSVLREDTAFVNTLSQEPKLQKMFIKKEESSIEESFKVPTLCNGGGNNEILLTPVNHRERPQLKLNIAAAANASKFSSTLNTPEVLRPLVDGDNKEFNLLQYVCNDGEFPGFSQEADEDESRNVGEEAMGDHDYTEPSWQSVDVKSDFIIKSEPGSPASTTCSISNSSTSKGRKRRKRQRDDSSDFIASESDASLSEDSQEWSPTPVKKRTKRKTSINSTKSGGKSGVRRKKSVSRRTSTNQAGSSESATGSVGGELVREDRYRALRERNNEASRRSRMNRKQRDVEMVHMADELYKKNVYLKARAEKMESLVKYMRAEIMKALTKPK